MIEVNRCWIGSSRGDSGSRSMGHRLHWVVLRVITIILLAACGGSEPTPDLAVPATLFDAQTSSAEDPEWVPEDDVQGPIEEEPVAQPEPEPVSAPLPEPKPLAASADPYAYPAWNGIDLDCPDVGHKVRVVGADPHRLDRDGDGWGCERY